MTFHIFFMYPETQGKTLEEVAIVFESNVAPWKSKNVQVDFDDRVRRVAEKERNGEHVEQIIEEEKKDNSMDFKETV